MSERAGHEDLAKVFSSRGASPCGRVETPGSRRDFLARAGGGFGAIALAHLLDTEGLLAAPRSDAHDPNASDADLARRPDRPHHPQRATSVIWIFLEGGPSHIDLFDPKPLLNKLAGQKIPDSFKPVITAMGEFYSPLLECKRTWARHGDAGTWVSDWLPEIARHVDDIAVLRSCYQDGLNHVGSVCQMNTGSVLAGRPSLGSWATYGLGSANRSLPSYVVLLDREATVAGGPRNWGTGFMPVTYQGTKLESKGPPIRDLVSPLGAASERRDGKLRLLDELNRLHLDGREHQSELEARIRAYELAYRMQAEAPEAVDLSREDERTKAMYGLDDKETAEAARVCLLARRLVERGVRFVQVYLGAGSRWDAHAGIERNHSTLCRASDKPVAALLQDLKDRGLLDETLLIWGGEFGRTPMSEKGDGRDHNPTGFTMWFAGGGIRGGQTIGETDELGLHAISKRAHVRDI
ncbi:MAG TPA: DUF1501 domain-containing protein, partial [Planctomycetota bacterium]|nr:DUF1501 domain-containing protein [Planctomycetota bacterium]